MTDDGYPTEDDLDRIEKWGGDHVGLMAFVKAHWHYSDRWHEEETADELSGEPVHRYCLSTGGWSGNESLVDAMHANFIFWVMCWRRSERGGHYQFEVKQ